MNQMPFIKQPKSHHILFPILACTFGLIVNQEVSKAQSSSILEKAYQQALTEYERADQLHRIEAKKTDSSYDPCVRKRLAVDRKNAKWFLDQYPQFQEIEKSLKNLVQIARQKIIEIQKESINVNPIEGQTVSEVPIFFGAIVEYLSIHNSRFRNASEERKVQLRLDLDDPESTELNLTHQQIVGAAEQISKNIQANLQMANEGFSLQLIRRGDLFELNLNVDLVVANIKEMFAVPLLETTGGLNRADAFVALGDEAVWRTLSIKRASIGSPIPLSVDGFKRFLEIEKAMNAAGCLGKDLRWNGFVGLPYLTRTAVDQAMQEKTLTPLPGLDEILATIRARPEATRKSPAVDFPFAHSASSACTALSLEKADDIFEFATTAGRVGGCTIINNSPHYGVMKAGRQITSTVSAREAVVKDFIEQVCIGKCHETTN